MGYQRLRAANGVGEIGRWTAGLLSAPAGVRCEEAEGAGLLDSLGPGARAELLVQVPLVGLDGVHRQVQLFGNLPRGQVGRQVISAVIQPPIELPITVTSC